MKTIDMTVGSPIKNLFLFAIPIALNFVLQSLYSLGDSVIVSLSLGPDAVTGINITGSLSFLVLGFSQGIAAGFGIVLSQYVGAKNEDKMRKSIATSILLTLFVSVVLTVIAVLTTRPVLTLMNTNEKFFEYSARYIEAIFTGLVFNVFYNFASQVMRAMGDSKTPLIILILCAVLNLSLNSLLFVLPLGVAWAGWATIISQGISAMVSFIVIFKKYAVLRLSRSDFKLNAGFCGKHLAVGLPMAFQFAITAISCMIQQSAFNKLPDPNYATAQGAASKIDAIFGSIPQGATNAFAVYCGQNYGAKKIDRIKSGIKAGALLGIVFSIVPCAGFILLCKPLSQVLLTGVDPIVFDYTLQYAVSQSAFYYALYILLMYRQSLQGIGKSSLTIFGGFAELLMRSVAAFVLVENFGYTAACFSNALAWVGGAIFFMATFHVCFNKLEKRWMEGSLTTV